MFLFTSIFFPFFWKLVDQSKSMEQHNIRNLVWLHYLRRVMQIAFIWEMLSPLVFNISNILSGQSSQTMVSNDIWDAKPNKEWEQHLKIDPPRLKDILKLILLMLECKKLQRLWINIS